MERVSNRIKHGILLVAVCILLVPVLLGGRIIAAARPADVVSAKRFELLDDSGAIRGKWEAQPSGLNVLSIFDANGNQRISLATGVHGEAGISIFDNIGQRAAFLAVSDGHQVKTNATNEYFAPAIFELYDNKGVKRIFGDIGNGKTAFSISNGSEIKTISVP